MYGGVPGIFAWTSQLVHLRDPSIWLMGWTIFPNATLTPYVVPQQGTVRLGNLAAARSTTEIHPCTTAQKQSVLRRSTYATISRTPSLYVIYH